MKISCPVCSASYMVPDTAIGAAGRKVKCASCGHHWHQDPPGVISTVPTENISADSIKVAAKKGTNVPVVHQPVKVSMGLKVATILLFVAGYLANNFVSYEESFGIHSTQGLVFSNIEVKIKQEENRLVAYITGDIKNESEEEISNIPPKVYFSLLSGQKRVMAESGYDLPKTSLAPGETMPFTPRIGNISGNAKQLVLDLGNGMERFFRASSI